MFNISKPLPLQVLLRDVHVISNHAILESQIFKILALEYAPFAGIQKIKQNPWAKICKINCPHDYFMCIISIFISLYRNILFKLLFHTFTLHNVHLKHFLFAFKCVNSLERNKL